MATSTPARPHPLAALSPEEHTKARDVIVKHHGPSVSIFFKAILLNEPSKAELLPFLEAEHAGALTEETKRPARQALVEHDVVRADHHAFTTSVVDLETGEIVSERIAEHIGAQPYIAPAEFASFQQICIESDMFQDALSEFTLPEGFEICIDPWPYGGPADDELPPRYMQGLVFAKDARNKNPDSNHYGYPIPLIPVMDWHTKKLLRVDRLATGGSDDGLEPAPRGDEPKKLFEKAIHAEYVPELLDQPVRADLKPINIIQPEGASFTVHPDGLIEWQRWRFRLGITPREGAVLHDVCYENRPILYRVSFSEMTVPYGDPRPPFQRKQAFDFGDAGMGRTANNLRLGCDCLGAIHYVDAHLTEPDGSPSTSKSVVCLHEQDNGILWKHTNFRTNRAVVTRNREFVVQFIATLANYEYVFAYKLDLAGGITLETRATGIMSVVAIDEGKKSTYGNIVAPGVLAQNHQHIIVARIDPSIDSYSETETQVVVEESHANKINPKNPFGNFYEIRRQTVEKATWIDAEPRLARVLKMENSAKKNPISGKNVAYKLLNPATQMLLADPESTVAKRAVFAQHNLWVTGYRDGEFWAAGELTNQSKEEVGGVGDMVKRGDWFTETAPESAGEGGKRSSPVVWGVFGLTHNPRIEDWPVMPVEIHQMHIRPADFFTANPALDVPSSRNEASVLLSGAGSCCTDKKTCVQEEPLTHLQGNAPAVDAAAAGANVEGGSKSENRLSKTIVGLFKRKD